MAIDKRLEEDIARMVHEEVGSSDSKLVRAVVEEVVRAVAERAGKAQGPGRGVSGPASGRLDISDCVQCRVKAQAETQARGVVTVTGCNRTGIVARFATSIAEFDVDIMDISQTIVGGFFTMIIILDLSSLSKRQMTFNDLKQKLLALGQSLGVQVVAVHEEIFRGMQRI